MTTGEPAAPEWPRDSLLAGLTPTDRALTLRLGGARPFEPGATIIRQGEQSRDVYLLLEGFVKIVSDTSDGRVNLLTIRGRGDLVGEFAALDRRPRSATVIAVTAVTTRVIDHQTFAQFRRDNPSAEDAVRFAVLTKVRQATAFRGGLGRASVRQRLAQVLLYLAASYGTRNGASTVIDVPFTQTELAAFVGAAEPSVHRALRQLRAENLLLVGRRQFEVTDIESLATIARDG